MKKDKGILAALALAALSLLAVSCTQPGGGSNSSDTGGGGGTESGFNFSTSDGKFQANIEPVSSPTASRAATNSDKVKAFVNYEGHTFTAGEVSVDKETGIFIAGASGKLKTGNNEEIRYTIEGELVNNKVEKATIEYAKLDENGNLKETSKHTLIVQKAAVKAAAKTPDAGATGLDAKYKGMYTHGTGNDKMVLELNGVSFRVVTKGSGTGVDGSGTLLATKTAEKVSIDGTQVDSESVLWIIDESIFSIGGGKKLGSLTGTLPGADKSEAKIAVVMPLRLALHGNGSKLRTGLGTPMILANFNLKEVHEAATAANPQTPDLTTGDNRLYTMTFGVEDGKTQIRFSDAMTPEAALNSVKDISMTLAAGGGGGASDLTKQAATGGTQPTTSGYDFGTSDGKIQAKIEPVSAPTASRAAATTPAKVKAFVNYLGNTLETGEVSVDKETGKFIAGAAGQLDTGDKEKIRYTIEGKLVERKVQDTRIVFTKFDKDGNYENSFTPPLNKLTTAVTPETKKATATTDADGLPADYKGIYSLDAGTGKMILELNGVSFRTVMKNAGTGIEGAGTLLATKNGGDVTIGGAKVTTVNALWIIDESSFVLGDGKDMGSISSKLPSADKSELKIAIVMPVRLALHDGGNKLRTAVNLPMIHANFDLKAAYAAATATPPRTPNLTPGANRLFKMTLNGVGTSIQTGFSEGMTSTQALDSMTTNISMALATGTTGGGPSANDLTRQAATQ